MSEKKYYDTWYAFECRNGGECGAVLDVRSTLKRFDDPSKAGVTCPLCGASTRFCVQWPADSGGYGSRGGPITYARQRLGRALQGEGDLREVVRDVLANLPRTLSQAYDDGIVEEPLRAHREALVELVSCLWLRLDASPRFDAAFKRAKEVVGEENLP